jgi:hypothetical protein
MIAPRLASAEQSKARTMVMPEGSRKYSKCHLNVLALADLPILPQRAVSQEIDNFVAAPHESGYVQVFGRRDDRLIHAG